MANEQRGKDPGVLFFNFVLPTGAVLRRVYHNNPASLAKCGKCGLIPDYFYQLKCPHHLCVDCTVSTRLYNCAIDCTRTEIPLPEHVSLTCNAALKDAAVGCPRCSDTLMFGEMEAHFSQRHPELPMQGIMRARLRAWTDNQAHTHLEHYPPSKPGNILTTSYNQPLKNWMSNAGPTHSDRPTQAPVLPGGSYDHRSASLPRRPAPAIPVYDNPAHTAVMGPQHDQEALTAPSSPHTYKDGEPAAPRDSSDVEMTEVDRWVQSPTETVIAEPKKLMTDVSNTAPCHYCSAIFHLKYLQEHQGMCGKLFAICWKLFRPQIFSNYQVHVSSEQQGSKENSNTLEEHMEDGLLPPPEFKRLIRLVLREYYEEHLSKQCKGIQDGLASFEEHLHTCQPFFLKCRQFWTQDVQLQKDEAKEYIQCSTIEHTGPNSQVEEKHGLQSSTAKAWEEAPPQMGSISKNVNCPFCLTAWDVAKIEEHVTKCEVWFAECHKLFKQEIQAHYKQFLGDGMQQTTPTGQIPKGNDEDGLLSSSVYQKWFSKVMNILYEEHDSKPWQKIPEDVTAGFKERFCKDESFILKCKELLAQVVREYQEEHPKDQCLRNKDGHGSFQEDLRKSADIWSGMARRDSEWQEHGDKGTSASSNAVTASENKVKEARRMENSPQSPCASSGDDLQRGKKELSGAVKCQFCSETWEPEEIADHLISCQQEFTKRPERQFEVHKDDYQRHRIYNCHGKPHVGNNVEKTDKDNGGGTTTKGDIDDLKNKVQELEDRLQALERPLKRLIERLMEESQEK